MNEWAMERIYVSEKYLSVFREMTQSKLFSQNSEFFMLCTFLGEKNGLRKPLTKRHELCLGTSLTEYDQSALKSLYLKEHGKLVSSKEILRLAEEYANGGIAYLLESRMIDIVYEDKEGQWHIHPDADPNQIQLFLFDDVLRETLEAPF